MHTYRLVMIPSGEASKANNLLPDTRQVLNTWSWKYLEKILVIPTPPFPHSRGRNDESEQLSCLFNDIAS